MPALSNSVPHFPDPRGTRHSEALDKLATLPPRSFEAALPRSFPVSSQLELSPREIIDSLAEYALAAVGRKKSIADFFETSPQMRVMARIYTHCIEPQHPGALHRRIAEHGVTSSVPLIGVRTAPAGTGDGLAWGARTQFDLAFMRRCPNSIGRSDDDLKNLEQRAAQIQWEKVGEFLEHAIRARLGLSSSVGLSACVFGSFLWKSTPGDIDMVVVVEDPAYKRITVGRPSLHAAGLREFMPAECRPTSDMVELCVIGIGALEEGQHLCEISDLLVAPTTGGLWVKGRPLLEDMSDLTIAQKWLSCLGNGVQESAMDPTYAPKAATLIHFARRLLIHTMRKYRLPDADALEAQLSQDRFPQSAAELVQEYMALRDPSERLIVAIREKCCREVDEYIKYLRTQPPPVISVIQ